MLPCALGALTYITNVCLSSGCFPDCLKLSVVSPLLKKVGLDIDCASSYRPITNTSFFAKLLERVVARQLTRYIEGHSLLSVCQSAYRPGHSTETAIVRVCDFVRANFARKRGVACLLLDQSSAFDLISHYKLSAKLSSRHHITGTANTFVSSFLSDRRYCVSLSGARSAEQVVVAGVPQGSVLGPLLFNLFVDDLYDVISEHGCQPSAYADDTQLLTDFDLCDPNSINLTTARLQRCVEDGVLPWMVSNNLLLNVDKSELIIFCPTGSTAGDVSLSINGDVIHSRDCVKLLGVTLDTSLSMVKHISQTCSAIYYQVKRLSSCRKYLSADHLEQLAAGLVLQRLDYCNAILVDLPASSLQRLSVALNCTARVVKGLGKHDHVSPALKSLHWLPVHFRILFKVNLLVFKALAGLAPTYITDLITLQPSFRQTRSTGNRRIIAPSHAAGGTSRAAFAYAAPATWNDLPPKIRSIESVSAFKTALKTHFFYAAFNN
jgi:hypothetical protein